jgi:hypothetical protein
MGAMTYVWLLEARDWGGVGEVEGVYSSAAGAKSDPLVLTADWCQTNAERDEWEQSDASGPIYVINRYEVKL